MEIKGLSLTRPWPWAFLNGPHPKRIENRSWHPRSGVKWIALHAAKSWAPEAVEFIDRINLKLLQHQHIAIKSRQLGNTESMTKSMEHLGIIEYTRRLVESAGEPDKCPSNNADHPSGEIFAICRLNVAEPVGKFKASVPERWQNEWAFGPYVWHLVDFIALPFPVKCQGMQGLWSVQYLVAKEIISQLTPDQIALTGGKNGAL